MRRAKIINQSRAMGLAIIIVFLVLSCVFTRPMISKGNHATYKDPYDPTFEAWTLAWDVKTLTSNPFNLFNSNIYFPNPHTLSYSDYQFTTAFIGAPLMLLTGNPVETANLMLIFNLFLCALGAYLLAKHLTGNRIGAFVAGVVFAFAAPRMAHMGHLQLSTAGWIPLCLLFLHKYSEEGKWKDAAMAALFFVLQTLATWYYGIMLSVAIMLFLLVRLMLNRKGFTLRWTLILLIAFALAGCVIAPFARPYLEVQSKNPRFVRTIEEVDIFSADVRDFAIASEENMVWGKLTAGLRESTVKRGGPTERSLFPGLLPLVLGIAGACVLFAKGRARERFYARFYIALAALAVVLCLGSRLYFFGHTADIPMPYDLFYYFFPGFKVIRVPPRFIILILLSLAVLSAFAVRFFLSWLGRRRSPALGALAALAIVGLLFLDLMSVSLPMYTIPLKNEFPPVYAWLKQQPGDAPTAELPLADYVPRTFKDGLQYEETWLAREPWRVYYSTLHWKKLLNGYSGFIPDSYYESVKALAGFPSKESVAYLKALGIEYVIVHANLFNPVTLQKVFAWSLKHHGLQPWKVFDANRDDIDYVYRLR